MRAGLQYLLKRRYWGAEEQLKAFLEAVKADAGLQAAADADAVVALAKAAGFAISADDLKKAQSEISEEELEGVAGGVIKDDNRHLVIHDFARPVIRTHFGSRSDFDLFS